MALFADSQPVGPRVGLRREVARSQLHHHLRADLDHAVAGDAEVFGGVLGAVQAFGTLTARRNIIKQKLSNALSLQTQTVDALLTSIIRSTKSAGQFAMADFQVDAGKRMGLHFVSLKYFRYSIHAHKDFLIGTHLFRPFSESDHRKRTRSKLSQDDISERMT